jgi:hypothetical protein
MTGADGDEESNSSTGGGGGQGTAGGEVFEFLKTI